MARLPKPGGDTGKWGGILNDFLEVAHNPDGTIKDTGVLASKLPKDGSQPMTGSLDMGSNKISNLTDGVNSADAINKSQLDTKVTNPNPSISTTLYVASNGSDSNDGSHWDKAMATIGHAVSVLGTSGGTINVGEGSFAPFTIDGSTVTKQGIRIIGRGTKRTIVQATEAGEHAIQIWSTAVDSLQQVYLEGLGILGNSGTGCGIVLGGKPGEEWVQMGGVHIQDCWISDNGEDGLKAYNINSCLFDNLRIRDNHGYGVRITGNSSDGSGGVTRGNTCVFINVYTNGNTLGGWLFDQCGNSWTLIGGEDNDHPTNTYAIELIPGANFRGLNIIGKHFERNWRAIKLGDSNATGVAFVVNVIGCFFELQESDRDVLVAGGQQVAFDGCQFGGGSGWVGVVGSGTGAYTDQISFRDCKPGASGGVLFQDKDGNQYTTKHFKLGSRSRLLNTHSTAADTVSTALRWIKNTVAGIPIEEWTDGTGTVQVRFGAGSPESSVTAPVGSLYLRYDGSTSATLYVKESGTGNTGWVAMSGSSETVGDDEIMLSIMAKAFANTSWSTYAVDTGAFGNTTRSNAAVQDNSLTWAPTYFRGGTYSLVLPHQKRTNGGIISVDISTDNSSWTNLTTIDTYNGSNTKAQRAVVNGLSISSGRYYVRLIVSTKNDSSSAYAGVLEGPGPCFTRTAS